MGVQFRVLGPVEVLVDDRPVPIAGSRPLVVLAALLLRANQAVTVDQLVRWLWTDDAPNPQRARATVQMHVRRLREALPAPELVRTVPGGYLIAADEHTLDLRRFQVLAEHAAAAQAAGDLARAAQLSGAGLALWRGEPLANVASDALLRDEAPHLGERQTALRELWADVQLARGEHAAVVTALYPATAEQPLHERLWEQLMLGLYRGGRQAEALDAYHQVSAVLADELGLDPGPGLQRLHQAILTGDASLDRLGQPAAAHPAPRQLPSDITNFTGRTAEQKVLAGLVGGVDAPERIATIEGTAGSGKTALAVHFAHRVADRFPDGQLYLNLRGHGPGEPVDPHAALATALAALGVDGDLIPADLDARAALWRTHTASRRLLVLLDNAGNTEQVRPLLPGSGGLVLVTSRATLRGLAATHGAHRIVLPQLAGEDAVALLAGVLGPERVAAEPAAARQIVDRCARLPLAVRILAERIGALPDEPLALVVADLDRERDRLAMFDLDDGEDTDLRAVFSRSYQALDPDAARLFRLLGLHPGADVSSGAAAALAGLATPRAARLLGRLAAAHLVEQRQPHRYEFHDLMRAYAAELCRQHDPPQQRQAAGTRVLDWYLRTAAQAAHRLDPYRPLTVIDQSAAEPSPLTFTSYRQALDWCEAERANLLDAVQYGAQHGWDRQVWQLAWVLMEFYVIRAYFDDFVASHELALDAARRLGDRYAESRALNGLGIAYQRLRQQERSVDYYRRTLAIRREIGDRPGEAAILNNLAIAYRRGGRFADSVRHGEQALAVATSAESRGHQAVALNTLAQAYLAVDRVADALACAREAIAGWRELGNAHREALAMGNLARALARNAELDRALETFEQTLARYRELDMRHDEGQATSDLGDLYAQRGDLDGARREWRRALELLRGMQHPDADDVARKLGVAVTRTPRPG